MKISLLIFVGVIDSRPENNPGGLLPIDRDRFKLVFTIYNISGEISEISLVDSITITV